jgi:hypothetical protein
MSYQQSLLLFLDAPTVALQKPNANFSHLATRPLDSTRLLPVLLAELAVDLYIAGGRHSHYS